MKRRKVLSIAAGLALLFGARGIAEEKTVAESAQTAKEASAQTSPTTATEQLEAKFKAMLTKATMSGRWCSIREGVLGAEREDKYTITGVTKVNGDTWIINARIQYNKVDVVAPIPVQVKWAGDTPVIIVDKLPIPGGGVYSARVLIYEHTYAGTWSGGDHGGLLNGVITNEKE
ncbi:MAG TPA: hypothetical protein VGR78_01825 [Verrucomicrobiae bacterium]|jgi:hypothetical protein|nr:hypothetical protein [Verrucomicrobiae bacterium]